MNDLDICKRIAEIEGVKLYGNSLTIEGTLSHVHDNNELGYNVQYNPLTDKALCFDLMVKYHIELTPLKGGDFLATPIKKYDVYGAPAMCLNNGYVDYNPQRAICLAIIEANKENT